MKHRQRRFDSFSLHLTSQSVNWIDLLASNETQCGFESCLGDLTFVEDCVIVRIMTQYKKYGRAHYTANKQYYIDKARKRTNEIRAKVSAIKESAGCADCGEKYPACVMDFDHVRGKKFLEVPKLISRGSWKAVQKEIQKCDLVCSNCHRLRTHNLAEAELDQHFATNEMVSGSTPERESKDEGMNPRPNGYD